MNGQNNNKNSDAERGLLPFFVDFLKFATGFAAIIAAALLTLQFASAAIR